MKRDDLVWLAGYLEGEGCFSFASGRGRQGKPPSGISGTPVIRVCSTDLDVLMRAADLMDARTIQHRPGAPRLKPTWSASIHGERAISLMRDLLPLMGDRRSHRIRDVLALSAARVVKPSGERCWKAKLSKRDVDEIRSLYASGISQSDLSRRFGVGQSNISSVVNLKSRRTA